MLKDNTKQLTQNIDSYFDTTPVINKDVSIWENIVQSDILGAQPIVSTETYEDYNNLLGDSGKMDPVYGNLNERRAQAQSGWNLLGKAIGQGLTEATLGSLEGIGYVLDFEELFNADKQSTEGFDNWFSQGIREAKEYIQEEAFPVYQTQRAAEGSLWERMGDGTFWASQGKTIGTTLSLLLPSAGVARVAGLAGKAARIGTAGTEILQGTTAAMFSRKAESAMEANQVFQQEHQKYLSEGLSDQEARIKAGESAATVFKANAAMLPMDMLQYTMLLKSFKGLKVGLDEFNTTKTGKIISGLTQMGSEAAEEAYQFVAQEEAVRKVRDGITPFGEDFGNRLAEYIEDPEFQTSAFLGGLMGGVFGAVGPVARKIAAVNDNILAKKLSSTNLGDVDSFNKIDNQLQGRIITKALVSDKLDLVKQNLEELDSQINEDKYSPEEIQEIKSKINTFKDNINYIQQADEILKKADSKYAENPSVRKKYSLLKFEDKLNNERINDLNRQESKLLDNLTDERDTAVYTHRQAEQLQNFISTIKSEKVSKKKRELKQQYLDYYQKELNALNTTVNELTDSIKDKYPDFDVTKYTTPNVEQIIDVSNKLRKSEAYRDTELRPQMAEFERLTKEEAVNKEKNIQENIVQNTQELIKETEKSDRIEERRLSEEATQEIRTKLDDIEDIDSIKAMMQEVEQSTTITDTNKKVVIDQMQAKIRDKEIEQAKLNNITETKPKTIQEEIAEGEVEVILGEDVEKVIETPLEQIYETTTEEPEYDIDRKQEGKEDKLESSEDQLAESEFKTTYVNIAYLAVDYNEKNGTIRSKLDSNKKLIFNKEEHSIPSIPGEYESGTEVIMYVYEGHDEVTKSQYETYKNDIDNIPIAIQKLKDYEEGKQPFMFVHKMNWITANRIAEHALEQVIEETKALREFVVKNGKVINITTDKTGGWINKPPKGTKAPNYYSVKEIIADDARPVIAFGNKLGNLDTNVEAENAHNVVSGIPYLVLPRANNTNFAIWLKQEPIKNNPNFNKYINTVTRIFEEYVKNTIDIKSIQELREEIGKYFHVNTDRIKNDELLANEKKDYIFRVSTNDKGQPRITLYTSQGLQDYYYIQDKQGNWNWVSSKAGKTVSIKNMAEVIGNSIPNKYPNITKKGVEAGSNFEIYEIQGDNIVKVKKNYIDFLSENRVVTSTVQPRIINGVRTYFSQPNIRINTDINKMRVLQATKLQEKVILNLEVTEKIPTFEELFPEGLPDDINIDEIFSKEDKQKAEDLMEYCLGKKNKKYGRK